MVRGNLKAKPLNPETQSRETLRNRPSNVPDAGLQLGAVESDDAPGLAFGASGAVRLLKWKSIQKFKRHDPHAFPL